VEIEITPAPSPIERRALAAALKQERTLEPVAISAWWLAGVQEAVDDGDETPAGLGRRE
jgi:hypothetical protein